MADLLDIAPATAVESVHITGDQRITVRGLHGNDIAALAARFPNMIAVFVASDIAVRMVSLGLAASAIIAAGCGHLGDEKAEQIAGSFLVEDQIKLVTAIIGLSFPNGIVPVIEALVKSMTAADIQKPVRVRLKKSPSASPPSSNADSRPIMQ